MPNYELIPFTLKDTPIDYFKFKKEYFQDPGFSFSKDVIELKKGENYLDIEKHLTSLEEKTVETNVFDFQVGKGKTSQLYRLMYHYYKSGYYIIVCSPFLKLVEKDVENAFNFFEPPKPHTKFPRHYKPAPEGKGYRGPVFYSLNLDEWDESAGGKSITETAPWRYQIHIMTIHRLLGDSGEDGIEQSRIKKRYIANLIKATEGKEVVLFFDELHESINNFKPTLIPNLLKWKGAVQKIFIASATYTPATVPVIKAISLLTDKTIKVYEMPRVKNPAQAKITVHMLAETYNAKSPHLKSLVKGLITGYNNVKRPVQTITGKKNMAIEIAKHCFTNVEKSNGKQEGLEHVNLLTADTNIVFQEEQNNIVQQ